MNRNVAAALAVTILALAAYLLTLAPSIHVGDSGELAGAAATLGIAHPPGYPLWTLLGRVAALGAAGDPAAATNVLSALAAALAAGLVAIILSMLTGRVLVSAGVALAFALSRGVWATAVVTEVYALNLSLTAAALAAALGARRGRPGLFLLAAYLLGLGTANHPFVLLAAPFVLALAVAPAAGAPAPTAERIRRLVPMAGLFLLGASLYLYLPLRWSAGADWVWGGPRGWGDLVDHVGRVQYGGLGEAEADTSLAVRWRVLAGILRASVPLVFGAFAVAGLASLVRSGRPKRAALLLGFFLLAGPVTAAIIRYEDTFLDRSVASVFFLPAVLGAYLLAGVGIAALDRWLAARLGKSGPAAVVLSAAIALAGPAAIAISNAKASDRRGATLAHDYAREVFDTLPPDARLFAKGDNEVFILRYYHRVAGWRPDVEVIDWSLNLDVDDWGADFLALSRPERLAARTAREVEMVFAEQARPVFYTDRTDVTAFGGCRVVPNGILHQLLRPGESPADLRVPSLRLPPTDPDDFLECHLAASVLFRQGESLVREGRPDEARARFDEAAERCGESPIVLRQVALARRDLGDAERAESLLRRTLAIDPRDEDALFDLGQLLGSLGRSAEAVETFDRLLELGFDLPEVHLSRGVQLVRLGDLAGATKSAVRALELAPGLEPAKRLAEAVARGYRLGGEAGLLEARRELGMIGFDGTLQLAARYLEEGEIERATELYREASQSAPDNVAAAYGLGYGLLQAGRWQEAGEAFRRVLAVEPESAGGRNALAYVFALTGDSLEVAERLAEEAVELDPSLSGYWYDTLGWVRHRRGRSEAALEALREAQRRLPPDDVSMKAENGYHLGVVLLSLGRADEASTYFRASLALAEGEPWVPDLKAKAREAGLTEGDA